MSDSSDHHSFTAPAKPTGNVSVLVLTKDEEMNIEQCLAALSFSDDVLVLDSYSKDRTVEVARRFQNVRVMQRAFDTEYLQRNFGLHEGGYKNSWVYVCDADERVPAELRDELLAIARAESCPHVAFRLRYKNIFMGKWIRHASNYPVWLIRLVRPSHVRYEVRQTNVHPIIDGTVGELAEHFIHYSFNAGLSRWFQKHNFYSDREALEAVPVRQKGLPALEVLRHPDPIIRRRAIKNLSFFLKGRAFLRFALDYVLRGGFLDGVAGFRYCVMIAMYEYWIELKIREQERRWTVANEACVERMLRGEPA